MPGSFNGSLESDSSAPLFHVQAAECESEHSFFTTPRISGLVHPSAERLAISHVAGKPPSNMRKDLETKLRADFPELYENLQYKQFECLDGWYDIIYRLSANLADIISNHDDMKPNVYTAFQVKEKFGALVFYMNRYTDDIHEAIAKASEESLRTCETCGGEGKLLKDSWSWRTICDGCEVERERQWQRIKAGDSAAVPPVDDMN